jgi:hypothetical protein
MTGFKLFKEDKEDGLFIKTCVLPCSTDTVKVPDCRDQIYTEEEIAILLSIEANNCYFDINHSQDKLDSIYTLQNYQSKTEEIINDEKIPVGSWIKIIFSENSLLNNKINNGEITGVSNDFSINTTKPYCKANKELPPGVNTFKYEDVEEKECVVQTFLSFVDNPCNQMPIEVMDYEKYKLNNGDDAMKLNEAIKKIFNKSEDKKYDIENSDDVVRIINEITDEKVSEFKDNIQPLFDLIDQDIGFVKEDVQWIKDEINKLIGEEGGSEEESGEEVQNEDESGVQNEGAHEHDEDSKLDKILNSVEKIENRVETLEKGVEEVKNKPVIKNQHIIKNLGGRDKARKGLFNRGE